jgi:hypothetical protein
MATNTYMQNRWAYTRPQAIAWSENAGELSGGLLVPSGTEFQDFLILSDHNRSEITVGTNRIENRKRMINATMRSYHIADKLTVSWDWQLLPSRAYNADPSFNSSGLSTTNPTDYTVDGGAGGADIVKWYEDHNGPFYMFMSYDRHDKFDGQNDEYDHLNQYNDVIQVYFTSFSFNIVKRGRANHDLWNISVTVEEA